MTDFEKLHGALAEIGAEFSAEIDKDARPWLHVFEAQGVQFPPKVQTICLRSDNLVFDAESGKYLGAWGDDCEWRPRAVP